MGDQIFTYIDALPGQIAHLGGTTLLAVLLVCVMAGAAAKTTAFTLVKSLGMSKHFASRMSLYGMALFMLTFAICLLATSRYALFAMNR